MDQNLLESDEERYFSWWVSELMQRGYIKSVQYQPDSFELFEGIKVEYYTPYKVKDGGKFTEESIMSSHIYTCDAKIIWDSSALNIFAHPLYGRTQKKANRSFKGIICQQDQNKEWYSFVEVKPKFDQNNMTRLAKINIQWVMSMFGEYVNLVIPIKHFKKTFTPIRYMTTNKSNKPRKLDYSPKTLDEFVKNELEF